MKRDIEIPITKEELKFILGDDFERIVDAAKSDSFCPECSVEGAVEMVNFEVCLSDTNNVVFIGECSSCKGGMARCVEIGAEPKYRLKTEIIKEQRLNQN